MPKLLATTAVLTLGLAAPLLAHHVATPELAHHVVTPDFAHHVVTPKFAHHVGEIYQVGEIIVSHAWMHENVDMAHSSSVYLTVENQGGSPDRLISAEVGFADTILFQAQTLSADGVLAISDVTALQVDPDQVLTLKPGIVWIELESVHQTFEHGEHFDMTLTFEKAGVVQIEVEIEPVDDDHEDDDRAA